MENKLNEAARRKNKWKGVRRKEMREEGRKKRAQRGKKEGKKTMFFKSSG